MPDNSPGESQHPLAAVCSLCGQGHHPNLAITIADEPMESGMTGEIEYRWSHDQCQRDHERVFLEAFGYVA